MLKPIKQYFYFLDTQSFEICCFLFVLDTIFYRKSLELTKKWIIFWFFVFKKNIFPSTINHQPSTINHQPSTINHQPSTINHQPSTINH